MPSTNRVAGARTRVCVEGYEGNIQRFRLLFGANGGRDSHDVLKLPALHLLPEAFHYTPNRGGGKRKEIGEEGARYDLLAAKPAAAFLPSARASRAFYGTEAG